MMTTPSCFSIYYSEQQLNSAVIYQKMEIPNPGECISYCGCRHDGVVSCNSQLKHVINPHRLGYTNRAPDSCVIPRYGYYVWTVYNLGFVPIREIKIGHTCNLYVGKNGQLAVCVCVKVNYCSVTTPAIVAYYNNIREVVAEYGCSSDEIKILWLEERMNEMENVIASLREHILYAPGGEGAVAAAEHWKQIAK